MEYEGNASDSTMQMQQSTSWRAITELLVLYNGAHLNIGHRNSDRGSLRSYQILAQDRNSTWIVLINNLLLFFFFFERVFPLQAVLRVFLWKCLYGCFKYVILIYLFIYENKKKMERGTENSKKIERHITLKKR